jgi:hypothetical protein
MILLFGWIILGIVGLGLGTTFIMDSAFVIGKRYNLSHTATAESLLAQVMIFKAAESGICPEGSQGPKDLITHSF